MQAKFSPVERANRLTDQRVTLDLQVSMVPMRGCDTVQYRRILSGIGAIHRLFTIIKNNQPDARKIVLWTGPKRLYGVSWIPDSSNTL